MSIPTRLVLAATLATILTAAANGQQVVISQIYAGAGGSTALYQGDYVELFNRGNAPAEVAGWSLQYASPTGTFGFSNLKVDLPTFTLQPGHYYLFRIYTPNNPFGAPIPADGVASAPVGGAGTGINLASTAGKLALVNTTNLLAAAPCTQDNPEVVDLVGYGTNNCAEGGAGTPSSSVTLAVFRANNGCTDTGNNAADFATGTPAPRNSATPAANCATTNPSAVANSSPTSQCLNQTVLISATVTPGANPTSTGLAVSGNFTALGGSDSNPFTSNGNGLFTASATIGPAINFGNRSVPITITDAQGRTGLTNAIVTVIDCSLRAVARAAEPGVCGGESVLLTVNVTPGLSPASTALTVTADLSAINGAAAQPFHDDATNGDLVAGDNIFSFLATIPTGLAPSTSDLPVLVADAENRTVETILSLAHADCVSSTAPVVVSQIYGGGGGTNAPFNQDYVELFNRTDQPVDLSGWALQYANNAGVFESDGVAPLFGSIPAGGYYLVGMIFGGANGGPLPQTDVDGFIPMFLFSGKLALTTSTTAIGANCTDPTVVDLAAYGLPNTCFDGLAPAPQLSTTLAAFRKQHGCQDTNHNIIDFVAGFPAPRNSATALAPCPAAPNCPIDFNNDGIVSPDDLDEFITTYFTEPPDNASADFNDDGIVSPDDLDEFITSYFEGC